MARIRESRLEIFIVVCALLLAFVSFRYSAAKTFTLDEVEEAEWAERLPQEGAGIFFDASGRQGYGVTHPLLFTYALSVFYLLFGASEAALRSFGIVFFFLTLYLTLLIARYLFKDDPPAGRIALCLTSALYLINPLLIQHSMLLNADNNVSAFFLIFFVYLFVIFEKETALKFLLTRCVLSVVVMLNFMAKEITPIFLLAGILFYRILNRQWKRLVLDFSITCIAGALLFWAAWLIYCQLTGIDFMSFLNYTLLGKSRKITLGFLLRSLGGFFDAWRWPLYWVSAPFFVLLGFFVFYRWRDIRKKMIFGEIDLIFIIASAMWIPYHFVKASIDMMKYQYPAYPLFIVCIAYTVVFALRDMRGAPWEDTKRCPMVVCAFFAIYLAMTFYYWWLGDYILILWQSLTRHMHYAFLPLYYLPIALLPAGFFWLSGKRGIFRAGVLGCAFLVFPVSSALNLRQTAPYTTAECWLNYGESGLPETVRYLSARVTDSSVVAIRKDIAYYLKYKYHISPKKVFTPRHMQYTVDRNILNILIRDVPIEYIVMDKVSTIPILNRYLMRLIEEYFEVDRVFGYFVIYRNKKIKGVNG